MGTGDYICVTLRGGAPWGFTLEEGEGETFTPFVVSQVEEGACAFLAGVCVGDEVVSINGEPCSDLTLLRASALIDTSIESLQLLLKRPSFASSESWELEETCSGETVSSGKALGTTTLHIFSSEKKSQPTQAAFAPTGHELVWKEHDEVNQRCLSPGDMVELQVSLAEQTLDDVGSSSLGSARGIAGELSNREAVQSVFTTSASLSVPCTIRQPLSQHGVVVGSSSVSGQVEVILQHRDASGRGSAVGGLRVNESGDSHSEGEEAGEHCEGEHESSAISFEIPLEEASVRDEQISDSDCDQDKPNKHHARHSRLRRNESLSEKQVKEAKSKCKRIALLLTTAPSNPNNKGVLMFKKHRQRAKKYTLVSYGTGEDEPECSNSEDEDKEKESQVGEFTFEASFYSESDKPLLTDEQSNKVGLTSNLDGDLLGIEKKLNNRAEMEGKGAAMFAQRRQRMDEISAEHDELRRQGLPVEGLKQMDKKMMEQSYMQSTLEGRAYMDVNMHQQSQQQYQQYQEQQYYSQPQNYQQQQQYQQYQQQQYEQRQYQQQQMYQQQQQEYHQEQQQMQQYLTNQINGMVQHQSNEFQNSFTNRSAKPFTAENMVPTPYSSAVTGTNPDTVGQGEQIASRDERIATPAIRTGILLDSKKRNAGKPMFTFKEAPKVSPNPALLNLLHRGDKKLGFESGPEEDYLSLGAEACNFLQSQRIKPKIPPPVAPKPVINPNSPPWSPQIEAANQDMPQCAENSLSTSAVAPAPETAPAPEVEPTPAPAPEPSPPPVSHVTAVNTNTLEQQAWSLQQSESQQQTLEMTSQETNVQMNSSMQRESSHSSSWAAAQTQTQQQVSAGSWHQAQVQSQEPLTNQSQPQPPWVTRQASQNQVQTQSPAADWNPQSRPSWSQPQEQPQGQRQSQPPWVQPQEQPQVQPAWVQPQEQSRSQPHVQPPWVQPQEQPQSQSQVQPPWAQPQEQPQSQPQAKPSWSQPQDQPQLQPQVPPTWAYSNEQQHAQQMQPGWGQSQEPIQPQSQNQWAQQSQMDPQQQPPWVQQPQKKSEVQPPWIQQSQTEPQPQPSWGQQPQHPAVQQSWSQSQGPVQPQPPWISAQAQQQPTPNAWAPAQPQVQAQQPWIHAAQLQPQVPSQANLNPWAPVPVQPQPQPAWPQTLQEQSQQPINTWPQEQNQAHHPPWPQPVPPQPAPGDWQQPTSNTPPQAQMNAWVPAQSQPQSAVNTWTPQSQQTPVNVSVSTINTRPSPKPWQSQQTTPQNQIPPPPPPPRRMHSFTLEQRSSSPINPMATVLNPKSSPGPAFEMPIVKGKGADMFAKRQSRMEKYVVDSETVEANKASRSTSPVASLPNEWKYTPNVRAPPSRAYNPIQSPSYPPAASKQPPANSPSTKAKKKDQEKPKPAPKPLNVIDVMKHQPYQLDSSLFIFGPGAEAVKPPAPKPSFSPPNPPTDNQPVRYEQMAPVQETGPYGSSYPQQAFGMQMQTVMHDSHYQQTQANVYSYQQPPGGPYQQEQYNQQYNQPAPPPYHPQAPHALNAPYPQAIQAAYQQPNSPPYMAPPPVPYEPRPTPRYTAPSFPIAARPESTSGGSSAAAPKPKFTANKSSAQAVGRSYSLSPPARVPSTGQKSVSASSSPKPPTHTSATPPPWQTSWLEKGFKPLTPWEAASRHPLGLVEEAFAFQNLQQSLASNVRLAAQRKMLPEVPEEWRAKVSYQAPRKTGGQTWAQSLVPLPSFVSPTRRSVSFPERNQMGYRSLPRQWQPQKYVAETNPRLAMSSSGYDKPTQKQTYKSVYTSNTWSWRR